MKLSTLNSLSAGSMVLLDSTIDQHLMHRLQAWMEKDRELLKDQVLGRLFERVRGLEVSLLGGDTEVMEWWEELVARFGVSKDKIGKVVQAVRAQVKARLHGEEEKPEDDLVMRRRRRRRLARQHDESYFVSSDPLNEANLGKWLSAGLDWLDPKKRAAVERNFGLRSINLRIATLAMGILKDKFGKPGEREYQEDTRLTKEDLEEITQELNQLLGRENEIKRSGNGSKKEWAAMLRRYRELYQRLKKAGIEPIIDTHNGGTRRFVKGWRPTSVRREPEEQDDTGDQLNFLRQPA